MGRKALRDDMVVAINVAQIALQVFACNQLPHRRRGIRPSRPVSFRCVQAPDPDAVALALKREGIAVVNAAYGSGKCGRALPQIGLLRRRRHTTGQDGGKDSRPKKREWLHVPGMPPDGPGRQAASRQCFNRKEPPWHAHKARSQLATAFETVYGTALASGFTRMPFAASTLSAEQPLLSSELLGYGRDPLAPIKDAITADGDLTIPIDAEAFGFWLKAAFGDPITTGAGPYEPAFRSGSWTLPSMSIETGMPEVPRYAMYSGVMVSQLSWTMQRSGLLTASAQLVAQGETVNTASQVGTLADLDLIRFGNFNGSIKRDGVSLGNVI